MQEPISNIRLTCGKCAAKPNQKYLEWDVKSFIGKWVYKTFSETDIKEHLWVNVSSVSIDNKTLIGVIDNDPVGLKIERGT